MTIEATGTTRRDSGYSLVVPVAGALGILPEIETANPAAGS